MNKTAQYIGYFLNLVLLFFIVAIGSALFSLGERIPSIPLPAGARLGIEVIFYVLILFFFYSDRKFDIDIWIRSLLLFIILRIFQSFSCCIVIKVIAGDSITFANAFRSALYEHSILHMIQFLSIPFLAFPIIFGYARAQTEKEIEEFSQYIEEEELVQKAPSPLDMEEQIIPIRIWKEFFQTESVEDIKALLTGIKLSDYLKNIVAPEEEEVQTVSDISDLLKELIPTEVGQVALSDVSIDSTQAVEVSDAQPQPPETVAEIPTISQTSTISPSTAEDTPMPVSELSELEQLLNVAESSGIGESIEDSDKTEEIKIEMPIETVPQEPVEPTEQISSDIIESQITDEIPQQPSLEIPESDEFAESTESISQDLTQGLPDIPLELPDSLMPTGVVESAETEIPIEALESPETIEEFVPMQVEEPESGGYIINSGNDFFKISLRKLIELNQGKQGAQLLERLIKRGANFELTIPMTLLIPQLKEGRAALTVEYIYSEIPIELVNFMSSDQSGDLSEIELELPLQEIMSQTNPKVIFGSEASQEDSKWSKSSQEINLDNAFEDLALKTDESGGDEAAVVITETKESDISEEIPFTTIEETTLNNETGDGFSPELIEFATNYGVAPMMELSEKISAILLCPVEAHAGKTLPLVEWCALHSFSPKWVNTPCYFFVDSETTSSVVRIASGMKTERDAIVFITDSNEIQTLMQIIDSAGEAVGHIESPIHLELSPAEALPIASNNLIKDVEGYNGIWASLPGKTIAIASAVSDDEDHLAEIAGVGTKFVELLLGTGRIFATWQQAVLYSDGWILGLMPMSGGIIILELPENRIIQEIKPELQRVSQSLLCNVQ